MKNSTSTDLQGHRALVNYNYGLTDLLMALIGTVLYMFAVFGTLAMMGCATEDEMDDWYRDDIERSRGLSEYEYDTVGDFHIEDTGLMVEVEDYDPCAACPECCDDDLWDAGGEGSEQYDYNIDFDQMNEHPEDEEE